MECLITAFSFGIFMGKYVTSFVQLIHLGLNNIPATVCPTRIGYANALSCRTNSCKKKRVWPL